jgi:oxaloacetate decarboxylase alpha subunit
LEIKLDLELIEQLLTVVEKNNLEELDVRCGDCKVLIRTQGHRAHAVPLPGPASRAVPEVRAEKPSVKEEAGMVPVNAPLSGVFYRSPSPASPPFVEIGESVVPGQVLCIIEAMKLMNEIIAETAGTLHKVMVENGHAVEQKQVLLYIKP